MTSIIGWKEVDNQVFLKASNNELIALPNDIYNEILKEGPPSEAKLIRDLIGRIHEVRKERVLTVESVDKELEVIDEKEKGIMELLEGADDKLDVLKYSTILRSLAGRRASCSQRRHLVKLLHQEEGALSKELLMKL